MFEHPNILNKHKEWCYLKVLLDFYPHFHLSTRKNTKWLGFLCTLQPCTKGEKGFSVNIHGYFEENNFKGAIFASFLTQGTIRRKFDSFYVSFLCLFVLS